MKKPFSHFFVSESETAFSALPHKIGHKQSRGGSKVGYIPAISGKPTRLKKKYYLCP
jgi:hypothetical protein